MENEKIDRIINKYRGKPSALIQILLDIQSENHWLPGEALGKVSRELGVPLSQVQHIATFHKSFSLNPAGRHRIHICNGTSCHLRGSQRVIDKVQEVTGIKAGETDPDLRFSLEAVTCLGCCTAGPLMEVDGKHYGSVDPDKAEDTLKKCD